MRRVLGLLLLSATVGWGPEERISVGSTETETGLNHGALALDSAGRLVAAWAEADGPRDNFRIYTRWYDGALWGAPEVAVDFHESYVGSSLGAKFPALQFVDDDTLLMVWHDYRIAGIQNAELFTKTRSPGGAWGDSSTEIRLTTSQHPETNGDNSLVPSVVVDAAGLAHVAWYDYRYDGSNSEILWKSRAGGSWDVTPGDAPDGNISANAGDSHFAALSAGPDGSLHVAWRDNTSGSYAILYRRRDGAGAWSPTETLSPPGAIADGVTLAVAPDGTLVAAWSDTRTGSKAVFVRERSAAGSWGPARRASLPSAGAEDPALAVDADGRRHLVWQDARVSVFNREVFYQSIPAGGVWDSTGTAHVRLSQASGKSSRPTMLAGPAGRVFVLWQDARHGANEVYFRESPGATTGVTLRLVSSVAAFPNPFFSELRVSGFYGEIRVVDTLGRLRARFEATTTWSGRDEQGVPVPAGVYFLVGVDPIQGRAIPLRKIMKAR